MIRKPHDDLPERLRRRLQDPLPGPRAQAHFAPELSYGRHLVPPPYDARRAAVLLLLYPDRSDWRIPLTCRPETLSMHAGQVSFPGGEIEPSETIEQAALRELDEELGVGPAQVQLLGRLSPIYVYASNYVVWPCLAVTWACPVFRPDPGEVANLLQPALVELLDPANRGVHRIQRQGVCFRAPHIQYQDYRIWGATSMILSELLTILPESTDAA